MTGGAPQAPRAVQMWAEVRFAKAHGAVGMLLAMLTPAVLGLLTGYALHCAATDCVGGEQGGGQFVVADLFGEVEGGLDADGVVTQSETPQC